MDPAHERNNTLSTLQAATTRLEQSLMGGSSHRKGFRSGLPFAAHGIPAGLRQ